MTPFLLARGNNTSRLQLRIFSESEKLFMPDPYTINIPAADEGSLLKAQMEALLSGCGSYIPLSRIAEVLAQSEDVVAEMLSELELDMASPDRGVYLARSKAGYRIQIKSHLGEVLGRLRPERIAKPLGPAAVDTLSIIVLRQPIELSEINAQRGHDSTSQLYTLRQRQLVAPARERGPGGAKRWKTTRLFLEQFGLSDLSELKDVQVKKRVFSALDREASRRTDPGEGSPEASAPA